MAPPGGPEALFRIGPPAREDGVFRQTMVTGPWMLGADARPCTGSLAVLMDDVLGQPIVAARPDGYWPVSTELSIDLTGRLPCDGTVLHGESSLVAGGLGGGLSQSLIVDDGGRTVATGTSRGRYLPIRPGTAASPPGAADAAETGTMAAAPDSTMSLLGASIVDLDENAAIVIPGDPVFANPLGNVHGGILLCASEMAASLALRSAGHPLETASIRVTYLRPVPAAGEVIFSTEVLYRGRTLGVAQVISRGESGKPCTVATITRHNQVLSG